MSPRKSVEQELTREIIMEAARSLFVKEGYRPVTIRKIASSLGYSHGAIYYHFKSKAALFYALVEQDFAALNHTLDELMALELPAKDKLKAVLKGFIEFGLNHQNHYEVMFMTRDEDIQSNIAEGPNTTYEKFAKAINLLADKPVDVRTCWMIFLMLHGFVAHYCQSGQSYKDVESLAESYVHTIFTSVLEM